jgi:glucose-1-phosphate adenylyltransferase
VEDSVLLDGVTVGREAHIRKAILDRDVFIPDHYSIGFDREQDLKRFTISSEGVVIVPHGIRLE